MWKKKLNSLTAPSTTFLRRCRAPIAPPSTTATISSEITSKQSSLSQFSSPLPSSSKFQPQEISYYFPSNYSSSSRVLQALSLHLGIPGLNSNHFCSASGSPEPNSPCWNCNAVASPTTPFLVCQICRSVQPPDPSTDYFQILGEEKKYDIKVENLVGKYKDWQKKLHPDLVHTKSKLKLEGVEVDEEERISDPKLLAEIMEIREAVEDAADTRALNNIQAQIHKQLKHWAESFADAFQSRKYEEAISSIQRMTYYKRANEEIIKKL